MSNSVNHSFDFTGRVGSDVTASRLENGTPVANISVGVNTGYFKEVSPGNKEWQDNVDWFRVTAWRGQAENAEKKLRKGYMVRITGSIKQATGKTKGGEEYQTVSFQVETIQVLNKPAGASAVGTNPAPSAPATPPAVADDVFPVIDPSMTGDATAPDDDLPF